MIFFLASLLASSEASASFGGIRPIEQMTAVNAVCEVPSVVLYRAWEDAPGEPAGMAELDCILATGSVPAAWRQFGGVFFPAATGYDHDGLQIVWGVRWDGGSWVKTWDYKTGEFFAESPSVAVRR